MSREITRDRQGDFKLKWPCRNPETGGWCWCTKTSIKCRARGVRIRDFSGSASSNASGSVMATTPQSGGHYTQAEGDALCSGAFGGGSTMSHYNCTDAPPDYECTIYCNSTVPGQPPMALETVVNTSPVRERGPRKGVDRYRNVSGSETVKQAGLGAGIFTMAIVLGGAIYILSKISKQMDTK